MLKHLAILIALFFASIPTLGAESKLNVAFSVSAEPNLVSKIREPFEKRTGIKLNYVRPAKEATAVQIWKDLDQGLIDCGAASIGIDDWEASMKESKYETKNKDDIHHRVIGVDFLQFFLHPEVKIELNSDQLKKIFSGKVKNWKELGGPDVPIKIYLTPGQPGTKKFVETKLLEKRAIDENLIHWLPANTSSPELVETVSRTPGAIAYGGIAVITNAVIAPKKARIGRPITMLFRGRPKAELQTLFDFIRTEGPALGVFRPEDLKD